MLSEYALCDAMRHRCHRLFEGEEADGGRWSAAAAWVSQVRSPDGRDGAHPSRSRRRGVGPSGVRRLGVVVSAAAGLYRLGFPPEGQLEGSGWSPGVLRRREGGARVGRSGGPWHLEREETDTSGKESEGIHQRDVVASVGRRVLAIGGVFTADSQHQGLPCRVEMRPRGTAWSGIGQGRGEAPGEKDGAARGSTLQRGNARSGGPRFRFQLLRQSTSYKVPTSDSSPQVCT